MRRKLKPFLAHLPKGSRVLDIGSGGGLATSVLLEMGMEVVPLDIQNGAYNSQVVPVIYDGNQIPFNDQSFDAALLLTVLHHIDEPTPVLKEAYRVANSVLIIEDIYTNVFQRYFTFLADSIVNLFYSPCPHTNKSDSEWKKLFVELEMNLISSKKQPLGGLFLQAYYVLKHR